ncbi:MAG: DUF3429 domain-containing protein [Steroidobacteraceae bacterium]
MPIPDRPSTPYTASLLGYGGLVPFGVLSAISLLGGANGFLAQRALLSYGAVILSFVGAVHWGIAMMLPPSADARRQALWGWSVIPALMGWIALLLPPPTAGMLLVAGFATQYAWDHRVTEDGTLPAWYRPFRLRLTLIACMALLVGTAGWRLN